MPRAPFQVLVIPFRQTPEGIRYAMFKRWAKQQAAEFWQAIAGGGEENETPEEAARREAFEEAGIDTKAPLIRLDSTASIPVVHFRDHHLWGPDTHVIPEYSFGIQAADEDLSLSSEHTEFRWLRYDDACRIVLFDSNRTALWELNRRLGGE